MPKINHKFKFSQDLLIIHRKLLGYEKARMARLIGVSKTAYNNWESGKFEPTDIYIQRIAKILKTKPQRLLLIDFKERESKLNGK